MMMQRWAIAVQHLLLLLVWILSALFHVSMVCSFVPLVMWNQRIPLLTPAWRQQQQFGIRMSLGESPSPSSTSLEDEIKQLRDQAKGMLQSLEDDMTSETTATSDTTSARTQRNTPPSTSSNNKSSTSFYLEEDEEDLKSTRIRETRRQTLSLLEDTQWRIVFNIGREQGTLCILYRIFIHLLFLLFTNYKSYNNTKHRDMDASHVGVQWCSFTTDSGCCLYSLAIV